MRVGTKHYRSIWRKGRKVFIIDQNSLPDKFSTLQISSSKEIASCIQDMRVRGAPLIGVTAAYGVALAMSENPSDNNLKTTCNTLISTRPTAVNLSHSLIRMRSVLEALPKDERSDEAWVEADKIADEDVIQNKLLGKNGLTLIEKISNQKETVNVLTHCNAGWLATVDLGTALSPIFLAHDKGIDVHVWVDETRPRNQGLLTAWELASHGIPYTLIVDNAGGYLMQKKQVDMVIVGADRVSAKGDVCNKIGTYLKALSAWDNDIPFYAAVPSPTIDWTINDGTTEIPIEQRQPSEVTMISTSSNKYKYNLHGVGSPKASNPAFDVTPARLVTGLITDKGLINPVSPSNMNKLKKILATDELEKR